MSLPILILLSFVISMVLYLPFINFLYKIEVLDPDPSKNKDALGKKTPIFAKLRGMKKGTPIGGGFVVVLITSVLFVLLSKFVDYSLGNLEIGILLTLNVFMLIGLYDDLKKTFRIKSKFFGLRVRYKFLMQIVAGGLLSYWFVYFGLISAITVPGLLVISNPILLVILSTLIIVFILNAFNITDGVDGLSCGVFAVILLPILLITILGGFSSLSVFTALLLGSVVAYLYFNIYPARILLGDTGSLAFGAVLAVLLLVMDYTYLLPLFAFIYIVEALSTLVQWGSKKFRGKKVFDAAPLHYHMENRGWPEAKVTMRAMLIQFVMILIALSFVI